jgi:peptidoglycan/xylan/chitin deacetylase (PgdA/CDA1 family)
MKFLVTLGLILGLAGLTTSRANAGPVLILDYHTFLGTHTSSLDFSDQEAIAQLREMESLGFQFVGLKDAIAGKTGDRLCIVLTIDDGNHSVFPAYFKIFKPLGLKPFLFIYPHAVDLSRFTMTSKQIQDLEKEGLDMGAHGYFHNPMGAYTWENNPESVRTEALKPAVPLTKIFGYRPTLFAYPYGVAPPPVQELVKSAGYDWAFAANEKIVPVDFSAPQLDHWLVPRTIVYRWNVAPLFRFLKTYAEHHDMKKQQAQAPSAP